MSTFKIITDRPIIEGEYNPEEEYSFASDEENIRLKTKPIPKLVDPSGLGLAVSFSENQQNASKVKGHLLNTFDFLNSKPATDQNDPSLSKLKVKKSLWDKQFDKLKKDTPAPITEPTPNPVTTEPYKKDQIKKTPMSTTTKVLIGVGVFALLGAVGYVIYKRKKK